MCQVGDGQEGETVTIPEEMCFKIQENTKNDPNLETKSLKQLINMVFPNFTINMTQPSWLEGRSILTPTNANVDLINHTMVEMAPGPQIVLLSADKVDNEQDARSFSVEYCNTLNPTGLPRHRIVLKSGVPLMMLRNVDPSSGLVNGARMTFLSVSGNGRVMYCSIYDENFRTQVTVAIPQISLRPTEKEYPFEWSRRQFPVRVAFATTINKAQGDSLKKIGVWLKQPVFGHGQFYVAPSRVGAPDRCTFAIKTMPGEPFNKTRNVVYKEVLEQSPVEVETVPTEVETLEEEVEDITTWLDYDAIEAEFEFDFENEITIEEAQPIQADIRQRLGRVKRRPGRLTKKAPRKAVAPPPIDASYVEYVPMCEYERIREENIQQRNEEYLRIFGEPLDESRGQFSRIT